MNMVIPLVDLKVQYDSIKAEIDEAIHAVISDAAFIGGKYLKSFEGNFGAYAGRRHCIGVGNGTDALAIALRALGVGPGDEVITVANTFIATAEAITMSGAKVVFVDCDEKMYTIDIAGIERALTSKTKAIIPVHLYGQPADMDPILDLAKTNNLFVLEDAAQAHGAVYKGSKAGTLGDAACFSFFPGKNLGAYGDAGAVVCDDESLARRVRMLANHGRTEKYNHEFEGVNSRLDGLQAAILDVKLRHLYAWTEKRRTIARIYDAELAGIVSAPYVMPDVRHVYHLYVIRVKNRERVQKELAERKITTGIHYPIPLPFLNAYRYLGHRPGDFPVAEAVQKEILSIPIYGDMTDEQALYVASAVRRAVQNP